MTERIVIGADGRRYITNEPLLHKPAKSEREIRNATLDEIADKIGKMPFGDTAASFAVWIREQKT
jgi:hypothetical protein